MDGKVKVRPPMTIPASLGRQIGILPVRNEPPILRRPNPREILPPPGHISNEAPESSHFFSKPSSRTRSTSNTIVRRHSDRVLTSGKSSFQTANDSNTKLGSIKTSARSVRSPSGTSLNSRSERSSDGKRSSRSTRSNSRLPSSASDVNTQDEAVENDILFLDIPGNIDSASEPLPTERRSVKVITEKDVLQQNQETDVTKVYEVSLHAGDITKIANLEKFVNLRVLDLSCNFIQKIENLDKNKDLRELKLYDNKLTVIENLKNLKELCSLQLQYNKIKQIGKGLSSLTKLRSLRIDCNRLLKVEASDLSCCINLTSVNVSYNMLDSLSALNYLPNLEEVYAAGNRIRQLDLSRCKKLTEIDVSKNRISDLSSIKGLSSLQTLNITSNQVSSLKPLGKSKALQEVYAAENKISELSFLPSVFPRLEILNISCNNIQSLDEVCSLCKLEDIAELFIHGNPFCVPDGNPVHYISDVQSAIPQLEILDGAHVKRHTQKGAPLMRPMTASTIVSVRQVETQMKANNDEMASYEKSILDRFQSLKDVCDSLYTNPPPSSSQEASLREGASASRTSSRARIQQALKFASENFDD